MVDAGSLALALDAARSKARCDYAQFLGAGPDNAGALPDLAQRAAGLKMYLDQTYGPLRLDDMTLWMEHFARWPKAAHRRPCRKPHLAAVILIAALYDRPLHVAHVSPRGDPAHPSRQAALQVTCEVTPIIFFLTRRHPLAAVVVVVRPRLATVDRDALWDNLM